MAGCSLAGSKRRREACVDTLVVGRSGDLTKRNIGVDTPSRVHLAVSLRLGLDVRHRKGQEVRNDG